MTPSASLARELLLYTLWAERHLLSAVRPVSQDHLTREAGVSFGSLLGTMSHLVASQKLWLSRFLGTRLDPIPTARDHADLLSWIQAWEESAADLEAFLAMLTEEQLATDLTWTSLAGQTYTRPLWQPVMHMVNHATYHRGQAVSLLRQMGYAPPSTDLVQYFIERGTP